MKSSEVLEETHSLPFVGIRGVIPSSSAFKTAGFLIPNLMLITYFICSNLNR